MASKRGTGLLLILATLRCIALSRAKVVGDFAPNCDHSFYERTRPVLAAIDDGDPSAVRICQRFWWGYRFASLYSTRLRIPLYSAYVLHGCAWDCLILERVTAVRENTTWFVEPQLSNLPGEEMRLAGGRAADILGAKQAVLGDYESSSAQYALGQLNPYHYHSTYGALATFTLTNAVPFDHHFHQAWLRGQEQLKQLVGHMDGTAYFITGVIVEDSSRTISGGRVTVPSHVWTAMCYRRRRTGRSTSSFSLGLIGRNGGGDTGDAIVDGRGGIRVLSLAELTARLRGSHRTSADIRIFHRDCPGSQRRARIMQERLQLKLDALR